MVPPHTTFDEIPIENQTIYEVTLKLCTLYKGVPYGPAFIQYTHSDPKRKDLSFDGVGIFTEGKLHMGPCTAINGNGDGYSYR
jgi:hypothetical protein